jgi:hypothetical protein
MRKTVVSLMAMGLCFLGGAGAQTVNAPLQLTAGQHFTVNSTMRISEFSGVEALGLEPQAATALAFLPDITLQMVWGLEVKSWGADGGVFRWTVENGGINAPMLEGLAAGATASTPGASAAISQGLDQVIGGALVSGFDVGFECRVDRSGRCIELLNYRDWQRATLGQVEMVRGILTAVGPVVPATPGPDGKPPQVPASRMFAMVNTLIGSYTNLFVDGYDARSAAAAFGLLDGMANVQAARAGATTVTFPQPLGGGNLPTSGQVNVVSVDQGARTAQIRTTLTADPAAMCRAAAAQVQAMGPLMDQLGQFVALAPSTPGSGANAAAAEMAQMRTMLTEMASSGRYTLSLETTGTVDLTTGLAKETRTLMRSSSAWGPANSTPIAAAIEVTTRLTPGRPALIGR